MGAQDVEAHAPPARRVCRHRGRSDHGRTARAAGRREACRRPAESRRCSSSRSGSSTTSRQWPRRSGRPTTLGPGAKVAGVGYYIDGQLAGSWGQGHRFYLNGPFFTPADTGHGWQIPMTPADVYRAFLPGYDNYVRTTYGNPYPHLPAAQQTTALTDLQTGKASIPIGGLDGVREHRTSMRCSGRTCSRGCSPTRPTAATWTWSAGSGSASRATRCAAATSTHDYIFTNKPYPYASKPLPLDAEGGEGRARRVGAAAHRARRRTPRQCRLEQRWEGCSHGEQEGRRRDRRGRLGRRDHRRRADEGRARGGRRSNAATTAASGTCQDDHDELRYAIRNELFQNTANETWTFRHNLARERPADPSARRVPARHRGSAAPASTGTARPGGSIRATSRSARARSSATARRRSRANMTIQDWGITYDELEPYYDKFEYMAGIAGKAGNLKGQQIAGRERLRGAALARVPGQAAARHRDRRAVPQARRHSLGYHPFTRPDGEPAERLQEPGRDRARRSAPTAGSASASAARSARRPTRPSPCCPSRSRPASSRSSTTRTRSRSRTTARPAQSILYYDSDGPGPGAAGRHHRARPRSCSTTCACCCMSKLGKPYDPVTNSGVVGKNYAYQTGGGGATGWFNDQEFKRYMGAGALSSRSTTSTPTTSTTPGLGFLGGGSITVGAERRASDPEPHRHRRGRPRSAATGRRRSSSTTSASISVGFQGESPAYQTHFLRPRPELPRQVRPAARCGSRSTGSRTSGR